MILLACEEIIVIRILKVRTLDKDSASYTSNTLYGYILDKGEGEITDHGFYLATTPNPTQDDFVKSLGSTGSTGEFKADLNNLSPNTTYYYVAYAEDQIDTREGKENSFTTLEFQKPEVTTKNITVFTDSSAVCGGLIGFNGGQEPSSVGFCWDTDTLPEITDNKIEVDVKSREYSDTITNLLDSTRYYVRAFAINSKGTGYGSTVSFRTKAAKKVPFVSTSDMSEFSENWAVVGGEVTFDGNATITERDIYWGLTSDPVNEGTKYQIDKETEFFSDTLRGLDANTEYYIQAYAINSEGPGYGNTISFTTNVSLSAPTVTTAEPDPAYITDVSATVGGEVTFDGNASVTDRGVYYGTTTDPVNDGTKFPIGTGVGGFYEILPGLTADTKYYIRAYATNSVDTDYGDTISFRTKVALSAPTVTTAEPDPVNFVIFLCI